MPKDKQRRKSVRGKSSTATAPPAAQRPGRRTRRQTASGGDGGGGSGAAAPAAAPSQPTNPGESLSWPSINLCPQNSPIQQAPCVLENSPLPYPSRTGTAAVGMSGEASSSNMQTQCDTPIMQPPMLSCVCDELGADVAGNVKEKIWRGEFVDLGVLTQKDTWRGDDPPTICLAPTGSSLLLRPQSRIPTIYSIEQWTSAFLIYASIYLERHTSRAREMLKYIDIVRSITRFGGYNWRTYDVQFRSRQARQPQRSWAVIDTELWLTVAAVNNAQSYSRGQPLRPYDRATKRTTLSFD